MRDVRIYYTVNHYTAGTGRSSIKIKKIIFKRSCERAQDGLNIKLKRAPTRAEPAGFPVPYFELAGNDVCRTRAFFALSDLELHFLAFIKSGVTVHLDFRVMNK